MHASEKRGGTVSTIPKYGHEGDSEFIILLYVGKGSSLFNPRGSLLSPAQTGLFLRKSAVSLRRLN
jgi:hypothetical protein